MQRLSRGLICSRVRVRGQGPRLQRALKSLEKGEAPEAVVSALARGLTNKLIHAPSVQMKKASAEGREWANGEFDRVAGLFRSWSLGGPAGSHGEGEAALFHALAVDHPAQGGAAERQGLPWRHGVDHGKDGVQDIGHAWLEGLLLAEGGQSI